MPKSAAFARIKAEVLAITRAIPAGQVTSFRAIGAHLDVVPRQVAYILATLDPSEQAAVPWHRVVSDDGRLERTKRDAGGRTQAELLAAEGLTVGPGPAVERFAERFFAISHESTGVPAGMRERHGR